MRTIQNLIPVIILLGLSTYGYQAYPQLPRAILNGIVFLPILLVIMVLSLSVHFNRSQVFFYALLISIAHIFIGYELTVSDMSRAILSSLLPLLLFTFTILPDRGIFSLRAIPAYLILSGSFIASITLFYLSPEWFNHLMLNDWLPARYFDWTPQSQSVLAVSITVFISMLILYFLQPSPHMSAGLGVLIMLVIQLHAGDDDRSLNVFSSIALLMCMYAVLQESWRMAYLDELTELPGRRALREKFQKTGGRYCIAMLDVDHFKKFNDSYGHDIGDAVLRMIANKMRKVSGGGSAYRYGGEEFCVVFNGKNKEHAIPHLEQLRETIANTPFHVNRVSRRKTDKKSRPHKNRTVTVTVSIGIADSSSGASAPWDILKQADKALYRAKGKGRNNVSD